MLHHSSQTSSLQFLQIELSPVLPSYSCTAAARENRSAVVWTERCRRIPLLFDLVEERTARGFERECRDSAWVRTAFHFSMMQGASRLDGYRAIVVDRALHKEGSAKGTSIAKLDSLGLRHTQAATSGMLTSEVRVPVQPVSRTLLYDYL